MEPSDEIRDLVVDVARAWAERDGPAWRALWSERPGVVGLGTDPRQWDEGIEAILSSFTAISSELSTYPSPMVLAHGRAVGFQEGSVGWGVYSGALGFGDAKTNLRITAMFHLERGRWKLVHVHRSFGVLDEDQGFAYTSVLERMADTVARDRPTMATATAPNGTVTILFTDIEDSTLMTERLGDRAWLGVLEAHNVVIRDLAAANSGFEVKAQGDGFMLAFASARDALRCGIGIQRGVANSEWAGEPLRVRIGLHTGEAIKQADDFYGKTVILAARIAAIARGAQILTSSLVFELLRSGGEFRFEGPKTVELKGLAGRHDVYAVPWDEAGKEIRSPA